MTAMEVRQKMIEICREKLALDLSEVGPENDDVPIFGKPYGFEPNLLVFFALELQNAFSIEFSEDQLLQYGLFTFNNIVEAVLEHMEEG